jgi:hypothetical protein
MWTRRASISMEEQHHVMLGLGGKHATLKD